jgi:hypothetical protein
MHTTLQLIKHLHTYAHTQLIEVKTVRPLRLVGRGRKGGQRKLVASRKARAGHRSVEAIRMGLMPVIQVARDRVLEGASVMVCPELEVRERQRRKQVMVSLPATSTTKASIRLTLTRMASSQEKS